MLFSPQFWIIQRMSQEDARQRQEPPYQYLQLGWETIWVLPRQVGSVKLQYICWLPLWSLQLYAIIIKIRIYTHTYIYSTYLLPSNISIFHSDCYYRKYHRALRIAMRYSLLFRTRYQSFVQIPFLNWRLVISSSFFIAEVLVLLTGYCQVHFFMCVSNPA